MSQLKVGQIVRVIEENTWFYANQKVKIVRIDDKGSMLVDNFGHHKNKIVGIMNSLLYINPSNIRPMLKELLSEL